jgi:hypothetical protein
MSYKDARPHDDDGTNEVDPWVRTQLSTHHLRWLEKQRSAVDPTEVLKFALAEWVVRHPEDWFGETDVGVAIRRALDEFIVRHQAEFVATE